MLDSRAKPTVLTIKKERITIMRTIYENIKKAIKTFMVSYMNAMEMYGEALFRSRGCACA